MNKDYEALALFVGQMLDLLRPKRIVCLFVLMLNHVISCACLNQGSLFSLQISNFSSRISKS